MDFGYVAVVGVDRFSIYLMYEDSVNGCDKDLIMDCKYKQDKSLRKYGKINCLDFEDNCQTFVTGTSMGWIVTWKLEDKAVVDSYHIEN